MDTREPIIMPNGIPESFIKDETRTPDTQEEKDEARAIEIINKSFEKVSTKLPIESWRYTTTNDMKEIKCCIPISTQIPNPSEKEIKKITKDMSEKQEKKYRENLRTKRFCSFQSSMIFVVKEVLGTMAINVEAEIFKRLQHELSLRISGAHPSREQLRSKVKDRSRTHRKGKAEHKREQRKAKWKKKLNKAKRYDRDILAGNMRPEWKRGMEKAKAKMGKE